MYTCLGRLVIQVVVYVVEQKIPGLMPRVSICLVIVFFRLCFIGTIKLLLELDKQAGHAAVDTSEELWPAVWVLSH